jgi:hypothetical protein
MRIELIPLVLGVLIGLVGAGLLFDAWLPDGTLTAPERRRRQRTERNHAGEGVLGAGIMSLGAALAGRDSWRYATLAMLLGSALVIIGAVMNWRFLRELLLHRGPARRSPDGTVRSPRVTEAKRAEPAERRKTPRV